MRLFEVCGVALSAVGVLISNTSAQPPATGPIANSVQPLVSSPSSDVRGAVGASDQVQWGQRPLTLQDPPAPVIQLRQVPHDGVPSSQTQFVEASDGQPLNGTTAEGTGAWNHQNMRANHEESVVSGTAAPSASESSLPLPLAPPTPKSGQAESRPPDRHSAGRAISTVLGSLGIVLGLFLVVVWITRRAQPRGTATLPKEVVELLGRAPLGQRQQMQLIRLGNKLILLSVTPNGAETLSEISDPQEVDRIAGCCRQHQSGSITESFRQILTGAGDSPLSASRLLDAHSTEMHSPPTSPPATSMPPANSAGVSGAMAQTPIDTSTSSRTRSREA